jgi:hypothetical protein
MTEVDRKRAIVAEIVAHAWKDQTYLTRLKKDPKTTLMQAGVSISPGTEVTYLENTPTVINAILPSAEDMPRYQARLDEAIKMLDFLPAGIEVRIHRDSTARTFFVMPAASKAAGELSDVELELVAGGKGGSSPAPTPSPIVQIVVTGTTPQAPVVAIAIM